MADTSFPGPNVFIPIARRTRLSDNIVETLSRMIVDGNLQPGTVIRTEELGRQLGVSRTPMREALQRLETDGFVTIAPNGVASVATLDSHEALQMMDLREVIDGLAARILAERGVPDPIMSELTELVERMQKASRADDKHLYLVLNARFHAEMLTATEHKPLQQFHPLVRITSQAVYMGQGHQPVRHRESGEEHGRILDAIRRREPAEAEMLARSHIRRAAEFWLKEGHRKTDNRAAEP
jgi:DNA-binding GntR family transcriptional regulator